jgi:predicted NAD/FAD-binding protein
VWNHHTYPGLHALFDELGIETEPTSMGFSVRDEQSGLEYAGETFDTLFAQRRNLFRPAFWGMIQSIVRFNKHARAWAAGPHAGSTLGELLAAERFPGSFRDHFLIPMGAAIWSASERDMAAFPAAFFVRFLANHGMLEPPSRQFSWRVMTGGSERYVAALTRPFADRIRLGTPVHAVRRTAQGVEIASEGAAEAFDQVVLALHADQARTVLADASPLEAAALAAFPYRTNDAVVHTDVRVLPRRRRAWASWNYHVPADRSAPVSVTYDLSRLQHLATPSPLLLTLNDSGRIAPAHVLRRQRFAHPAFTRDSIAMQARHAEVSGVHRVHFCGAYWRNGFHEDGFWSGVRVAEAILGAAHAERT